MAGHLGAYHRNRVLMVWPKAKPSHSDTIIALHSIVVEEKDLRPHNITRHLGKGQCASEESVGR